MGAGDCNTAAARAQIEHPVHALGFDPRLKTPLDQFGNR